jgi:hypothetical protein
VPTFDAHRLHINLWVLHGQAPAQDGEVALRVASLRLKGCRR